MSARVAGSSFDAVSCCSRRGVRPREVALPGTGDGSAPTGPRSSGLPRRRQFVLRRRRRCSADAPAHTEALTPSPAAEATSAMRRWRKLRSSRSRHAGVPGGNEPGHRYRRRWPAAPTCGGIRDALSAANAADRVQLPTTAQAEPQDPHRNVRVGLSTPSVLVSDRALRHSSRHPTSRAQLPRIQMIAVRPPVMIRTIALGGTSPVGPAASVHGVWVSAVLVEGFV